MFDDFDLVVSSIRTQYGLSLYSHEFKKMTWKEFRALLAGLSSETPLGRIVQIRSEEDPQMLESFSEGQHRIRNEWRLRLAKEKTDADLHQVLDELKQAFEEMAK
ncbi:hypothetical protein HCC45_13450 [Streptococcus suis]|nr:hypothetical protein [Streptococcus suis]MCK3937233.1 hypothetical protein [Streptococcus suis]